MTSLREISFGALAAERDLAQGLAAYFVESESFQRLKTGIKTIALGNRGSGKTAIFKMIAEQERKEGSVVIELAPEDYSYELLSQTMTSEDRGSWAKQSGYAAAWKYLIYLLAMKAACNAQKGFKTGSSKRVYNYLRDKHKGIELNPIGVLISYLKRLEGVKLGNLQAAIKAQELQYLYKLEEIDSLLDDLNQICRHFPVIILIDELDRGWDASEDAKAFVAGLVQAATSIDLRTSSIRVMLSLRKEIYENIPSLHEDAQKVRDIVEFIEWDEQKLFQLISNRLSFSSPSLKKMHPEERWSAVFESLTDSDNIDSFHYIVDRTLYRPRELLQYCIEVRNKALDQNQLLPININTVFEVEYSYSQEHISDIASEYRFQYPGLLTVLETFRDFEKTFDRSTLELRCIEISVKDVPIDPIATWCFDVAPEQLISVLWQIGFLQVKVANESNMPAQWRSKYLGSHQIKLINLMRIQSFQIHPLFHTFLGFG
ncbi:P-loop ATPase, Sll1717 family [Sphaerothrix gracilis]|uniref:P-loop ATPase, Sll1717 family n=1 Tax=Sphaerothrix gracilis TaxID=3151835 RepID=UPI0031FD8D76